MDKDKSSLFIAATGFLIALCRFIIGCIQSNERSLFVLMIMATVNYVSIGIVIWFMYVELYQTCKSSIEKSGIDTDLKNTCRKINSGIAVVLIIVYVVLGIIYLCYFKSENLNDTISIFALSLSIASNKLVKDYGASYFKFVLDKAKKYSLEKT